MPESHRWITSILMDAHRIAACPATEQEPLMAISRTRFMLVALTAMLLLVSACSSNEEHSSSPTSLQVLQKSAAAMKQLKSAHFTIQLVDTVNATSATPTT